MATLDRLDPTHRAILELVLKRGRSYAQLGPLLTLSEERVRVLAHEALGALAPITAARVEPDWHAALADYVLGQQSERAAAATRLHLTDSEASRAWVLSLVDSLDGLYANGARPHVPTRRPHGQPATPGVAHEVAAMERERAAFDEGLLALGRERRATKKALRVAEEQREAATAERLAAERERESLQQARRMMEREREAAAREREAAEHALALDARERAGLEDERHALGV